MKFKFRLAKVEEYRRRLEDARKKEFKLAQDALESAIEELRGLQKKNTVTQKRIEEKLCGELTPGEISIYINCLEKMVDIISQKRDEVKSRQLEVENKKQRLIEAMQARKLIERLRERRYEEFKKELKRIEQNLTDEFAKQIFLHKSYGTGES